MPPVRRFPGLTALLLCFALLPAGASAQAEDPTLTSVLQSSVRIHVSGTDRDGIPVEADGTGFFVSTRGHILTSWRALGTRQGFEVSYADPPTVTVQVWEPDEYAYATDAWPAVLVASDPVFDLALLRIAKRHPNNPPSRCAMRSPAPGDTVRAVGFRRSAASYEKLVGNVFNTNPLTAGERFRIGTGSDPDLSGSPVFDDATIIGIVTSRGEPAWPSNETYFMPLEWALRVLPPTSECRQDMQGTPAAAAPAGPAVRDAVLAEAISECVAKAVSESESKVVGQEYQKSARSDLGALDQGPGGQEIRVQWVNLVIEAPRGYVVLPPVDTLYTPNTGSNGWYENEPPAYTTNEDGEIVGAEVLFGAAHDTRFEGQTALGAAFVPMYVEMRAHAQFKPLVDDAFISSARKRCELIHGGN